MAPSKRTPMSANAEEQSLREPSATDLFQGGCSPLVMFFGIYLISLTVLKIFVGPQLAGWWRDHFGDPIFRVIARAVILVQGDTVRLILLCGLGVALVLWAVRIVPFTLSRGSIFRFRTTNPQTLAVDTAHDQLRRMFSDDPQQVALYDSRLIETQRKKPTTPLLVTGMGCTFSLIATGILIPLSLLVTLGVFDGLQRLFGAFQAERTIEQSAGPFFVELNQFMPLQKTAFGIDLMGRSALLCIAVALLAALRWFAETMPVARPMRPRGILRSAWICFFAAVVLMYALANGLVLYLMIIVLAFNLTSVLVGRFLLRPLRLHAMAVWMRMRNRHRDRRTPIV